MTTNTTQKAKRLPTPGPWFHEQLANGENLICFQHIQIARIVHLDLQQDGGRDRGEEIANAKLIAQAPAMREVLQAFVMEYDSTFAEDYEDTPLAAIAAKASQILAD